MQRLRCLQSFPNSHKISRYHNQVFKIAFLVNMLKIKQDIKNQFRITNNKPLT